MPGPSTSSTTDEARAAVDANADIPESVLDLAEQLLDFPRHLSVHSGGMVICDRPVIEVCPVVGNCARSHGLAVGQGGTALPLDSSSSTSLASECLGRFIAQSTWSPISITSRLIWRLCRRRTPSTTGCVLRTLLVFSRSSHELRWRHCTAEAAKFL